MKFLLNRAACALSTFSLMTRWFNTFVFGKAFVWDAYSCFVNCRRLLEGRKPLTIYYLLTKLYSPSLVDSVITLLLAANCQYNLTSWDQLLLTGFIVDPFNIGLIWSGFNQWTAHPNPQWNNSHITCVLLKIILWVSRGTAG